MLVLCLSLAYLLAAILDGEWNKSAWDEIRVLGGTKFDSVYPLNGSNFGSLLSRPCTLESFRSVLE